MAQGTMMTFCNAERRDVTSGDPRLCSRLGILAMAFAAFVMPTPARGQSNCPSGIQIHVDSGDELISIWSPLSNGTYGITQAWNTGTHTRRDQYSLDLNMNSWDDFGKAVFLPITGRVWAVATAGQGYGNTVLIWDPASGIVMRLGHLSRFASAAYYSGNGDWLGAGVKTGYIGNTGWPQSGPHLHVTSYRNVRIGAPFTINNTTHPATEEDIVDYLSRGLTPPFAQAQKFRLVAPSDNCELIHFDDNPAAIYTYKNQVLYPVTFDVWESWGTSIDFVPLYGTLDQAARSIPTRLLPADQRSSYAISSELAPPRVDSVFVGSQYPDTYVFRSWGQKILLSGSQFGDPPTYEFRWEEVQPMEQSFVDAIQPRTYR